MARFLTRVALAGLPIALARQECADGSCAADDVHMVQIARHKYNRSAFAKLTRPFMGGRGGSLREAEHGAIQIDEDGVVNTYYLPGANTIDGGKTVKFTPPYRFYLMKSPTTDYSNAGNFYMPEFMGKTFSVDMNFGRNGPSCGCNLNFYLVDMPANSPGDEGDWYCDAQCFVGKGCCAEFDMNEGNMDVQQITNHACTNDYSGHSDWACHKWGDPEAKTHSNEFGIGSQYTIDSTKPFTFSQKFEEQNGQFIFTTILSQDGKQVVKPMGPNSGQLNAMMQEIKEGMAFVTGYWSAPDMNWMDGEACGSGPEHCNNNPAYISNWRLTSNGGPVPSPQPSPSPTPPNPNPAPAPVPAPSSGGKCCWGPECTNCKDSSNWCGQSMENCWQCNGGWCAA